MRQLILLSLMLASSSALASPITDTVMADGREWAQVTTFAGISWEDVNTACSAGDCSGTLNHNGVDYDVDGWEWASVDRLNSLFNYYLGGSVMAGPSFVSGEGITEIFFSDGWRPGVDNGGWPAIQTSPSWIGVFGWTSTIIPDTGIYLGGAMDLMFEFPGVEDNYSTDAVDEFSNFFLGRDFGAGVWLSREANIDVPPTFMLVLIGLFILRRKTESSGHTFRPCTKIPEIA